MAQLINDIEWGEPTLPIVQDPEWEAEVKADMGMVPDLMGRVSRSPWLRKACLKWPRYSVTEFPRHLGDICNHECLNSSGHFPTDTGSVRSV